MKGYHQIESTHDCGIVRYVQTVCTVQLFYIPAQDIERRL